MATTSKGNVPATTSGSLAARLFRSRETGIIIALVLMVVLLSIAAPEFRSPDNLLNNARNFSYVGMVVIGQAMVMITGGIDLSVGSVWGVSAVTAGGLMAAGWPTILACATGLLVAALFGLFNGLCVTKLRMPPFVPTLATMSIARALALVITRGHSINDFRRVRRSLLRARRRRHVRPAQPVHHLPRAHRHRLAGTEPHRVRAPALRDRRQREGCPPERSRGRSAQDRRLCDLLGPGRHRRHRRGELSVPRPSPTRGSARS